jgi:hypothetical protein
MRRRMAPQKPPAPRVADLTVITGLFALLILAAALAWWGYVIITDRRPRAGQVDVIIGSTKSGSALTSHQTSERVLSVPNAWLRDPARATGRRVDRLDLVVPLMLSETHDESPKTPLGPMERVILMRVMHADESVPPEERASQLHSRFLTSDVWTNPGGLILRSFSPGSPYEGEELYLAPPDGRDFSARCPKTEQRGAIGAGLCIWEFRTAGMDVLVSFSPARLTDWQGIAATARETADMILRTAK